MQLGEHRRPAGAGLCVPLGCTATAGEQREGVALRRRFGRCPGCFEDEARATVIVKEASVAEEPAFSRKSAGGGGKRPLNAAVALQYRVVANTEEISGTTGRQPLEDLED